MATTQKHRLIAVNSVLGEDVLLFGKMTFTEQLGQLFEGRLELFSEKTDIKLADLLGTNLTVRMELPYQQGTRYFNGFVTRFSYEGTRGLRYGVYRAEIRPWFWFLTRTSDCRIFQHKTVPDIVKEIFREQGFTDFKDALTGSYREWDYCVQYRETDFNFISRLLEQEGAYYYSIHENGKNILVLADGIGSHEEFPKYETVPFFPPDAHDRRERDALSEWLIGQSVQPGAYFLNDYDFTAPRKSLRAILNQPKSHAQAHFELYDYPGEYTELGDGNSYSKIRLEEFLAQHELAHGRGNAAGLAVGYLFSLSNCPRDDQNRKYLITSATHYLESDEYESFSSYGLSGKPYQGEITALDAQQQFRSPRVTPKPVVQGPQTAIVVGPAGEEIYTDQYGRVKCQFHWDRYGRADENSSCWIQVAQGWAGKKWGMIYLPRIGHEVIVEFLEGDPDRPIITGRVYNGINMPPYDLPAKATVSTLKSNSSKGGAGFNEFRFEDKKGEEQVFLHAERNEDIRVKNDAFEWIGSERHLIVKKKQFEQVEGEKHLTVKSGEGGKGDQFEKVEGEKHQEVKQDYNLKVGGTLSLKVDGDLQEKVGGNHALDAGTEIHLKAGMKVVIEAGVQLTIKVGGNFLTLDPSGVTIQGTMVKINSGGSAGSGSGSSPTAPTAPTAPKEAATDQPGQVTDARATPVPQKGRPLDSVTVGAFESPQAQALRRAAQNGTPFCEICEAAKGGA
ncbi:MAG: type VI secretion system tip protein VgrG [Candidatus Competibacteraceae bacterium]|nr:type VI secretion system tip protein VgrG [Candidatus Competibacteraceae bacterium]